MLYAPILITVYSRLDRLSNCIQSLLGNPEACDSILYIASDNYYSEDDRRVIDSIRFYCKSIIGFKDVILLERNKNLGSYNNLHDAIEHIINIHGKIIVLEDDNIVSPHFLKYMNDGLSLFEHDNSIYFVCSYMFPNCHPKVKGDVFLWRSFSPWGFATWKSAWDKLIFSKSSLYNNITLLDLLKIWLVDPQSLGIILEDMSGIIKATDVRVCKNLVDLNGYSVFPIEPVSVNRGHDGNGEHGSSNCQYMKQPISNRQLIIPERISVVGIYMFIYRLKISAFYSLIKCVINYILKVKL
ncbi:hypothetical protein VCSRO177_2252 [Vibrio cholerae]|nr:hypothetical protein [Vibrio cholerae]GHZ93427.1 hypothetical protein VCSRO177_2252 [Vibrio cholerae]